ncbi:hypothetical protein GOHSU_12_01150 [Gordonia hirsuta DSM 44140 = NBRC 16056]|uniref:AbiEi antitoxin C-terminal domain-containing protein n=1 Tax=Gordonia hirsuta DSM 44140 = NBRC 16056 TaxID=1121927 RepID=L7L6E4_9ACTN|nr:type IV toxin-antitoxin system AbiEi family antitoxin domain-containing protein [Gordonia hirsuta]GAC56725.1 hypothetical protein GOHSU_12_01150 [Gordonia hirsuta DSM 44140 = NBRC 16056]
MSICLADLPLDRHGLIRRTKALRAGFSDDQLAAEVKTGRLVRLGRGVLMPAQAPEVARSEAGKDARYRLACIAAATTERAGDAPLSHESAAALHRIPLLGPDRTLVHVIRGGRGGSSLRGGRYRHAGTVPAEDIVEIDGIRVTSLRRTAIDVALTGSFAQALTVVDAVLRRGVSREDLVAVLEGRRPEGIRTARRAIAHGSGLAESVGESWSRAQMIDADLPLPALQRAYVLEGHEYRPDFDWDGVLVGEFDGLVKYQGLLRPGEPPHEAVIREKEREDRLRRAGLEVVRWTWRMLVAGTMIPLLRAWLRNVGVLVG